jgi:hypothetical protein
MDSNHATDEVFTLERIETGSTLQTYDGSVQVTLR